MQNGIINKPIDYPLIINDLVAKEILFSLNSLKVSYLPLPKLKKLSSIFDMTNNLSCATCDEYVATLLDLAFKKEYLKFLNIIYNNEYNEIFSKFINDYPSEKVSILNGCLFVVSDLNKFLVDVRKNGYNINGGPQRLRSQTNSLNSFLSNLDIDFRESLYNHNNYHVEKGTIFEDYRLCRDKFSYKNIHMDMSNKGW